MGSASKSLAKICFRWKWSRSVMISAIVSLKHKPLQHKKRSASLHDHPVCQPKPYQHFFLRNLRKPVIQKQVQIIWPKFPVFTSANTGLPRVYRSCLLSISRWQLPLTLIHPVVFPLVFPSGMPCLLTLDSGKQNAAEVAGWISSCEVLKPVPTLILDPFIGVQLRVYKAVQTSCLHVRNDYNAMFCQRNINQPYAVVGIGHFLLFSCYKCCLCLYHNPTIAFFFLPEDQPSRETCNSKIYDAVLFNILITTIQLAAFETLVKHTDEGH